jgi:hypothetical protein
LGATIGCAALKEAKSPQVTPSPEVRVLTVRAYQTSSGLLVGGQLARTHNAARIRGSSEECDNRRASIQPWKQLASIKIDRAGDFVAMVLPFSLSKSLSHFSSNAAWKFHSLAINRKPPTTNSNSPKAHFPSTR